MIRINCHKMEFTSQFGVILALQTSDESSQTGYDMVPGLMLSDGWQAQVDFCAPNQF